MQTNQDITSTINIPQPSVNTTTDKPSVEIDINLKEKPKDEPLMLDFQNGDDIAKLLQGKTDSEIINKQTQQTAAQQSAGTTNPDATKVIAQELGANDINYTQKHNPEDNAMVAELIVLAADWIMTQFIQWFAKDRKEEPYKAHKTKLDRMQELLVRLLSNMQKKWPTEFLLLAVFLLAYVGPFRKAWENRKGVLEQESIVAKQKADAEEQKRMAEKLKKTAPQPIKTANTKIPTQQQSTRQVILQPKQTEIKPVETVQKKEEEVQKPVKKTISVNTSDTAQKVTETEDGGTTKSQEQRKIVVPSQKGLDKKVSVPSIPRSGKKIGVK